MKKLRLILLALGFIALSASHLSAQSGTTYRDGPRLTCASDDGKRHYCAADTRYGVRMVNQRSGSPCTKGYTWGYDPGRLAGGLLFCRVTQPFRDSRLDRAHISLLPPYRSRHNL
ncbi:MAG: DUF3011 domain-containing protein [Alloacidobacterium sp.]